MSTVTPNTVPKKAPKVPKVPKSPFTTRQQAAIAQGNKIRKRLVRVIEKAVTRPGLKPAYIYSPPGLGKTFTVTSTIAKHKIVHKTVSGNMSMFAFGIQLATLAFKIRERNFNMVINVDDCDELLKNEININTLKNMLEGHKEYAYNKSMRAQMNGLTDIQKKAVEYYSDPTHLGFVVPTDRFQFIFTSNFQLPYDDDVTVAYRRGGAKAILMGHRNAIRSRCQTNDFRLEREEHWGWIADVVLNTTVINVTNSEKFDILNWLDVNWDELTERSIRTIKKMADAVKDNPQDYVSDWEIDFIK